MQNKKNILIVIGLVVVIIIGSYLLNYFLFSFRKTEQIPSEKSTSSEEVKKSKKEEEIKITSDGFDKNSVNINQGEEFSIMNYSNNTIVLVNEDFFPEGHILETNKGVGFPGEGIKNQQIKELTFWLQNDPKEKLKVNIIK